MELLGFELKSMNLNLKKNLYICVCMVQKVQGREEIYPLCIAPFSCPDAGARGTTQCGLGPAACFPPGAVCH